MNRAIIDHLSNEEYHADPAVSASHLHQVARSGSTTGPDTSIPTASR
jgi:hypothetical protein